MTWHLSTRSANRKAGECWLLLLRCLLLLQGCKVSIIQPVIKSKMPGPVNDGAALSLCPITLESLPDSDLDVGIVFGGASPSDGGGDSDEADPTSKNGNLCRCSLDALVRYVQGAPVTGRDGKTLTSPTVSARGAASLACPVCHGPIGTICDGIAASGKLRNKVDVVSFRYGKHNYYLSVPSSSERGWFGQKRNATAQERIASVLGMNMKNGGLKILYKGKVICPDSKRSAEEISKQLLNLSNASAEKKCSKPDLVVMGTRSGDEVISAPGTASSSYREGMFSLVRWGIAFLLNTTQNILGGLVLFAKSLFIMPAAPSDGRNHED